MTVNETDNGEQKNVPWLHRPEAWTDQGFLYHFPTPFTLSVGALRGGSLDQNFLIGGSLDHFRARRARKSASKAPFQKILANFRKKWPKNAIKINFSKNFEIFFAP